MLHPRFTVLYRTRYIVATLCMLLSTITLWAQESSHRGVKGDVYEALPDSLRRSYRHSDAVQRLAIHGDTLSAQQIILLCECTWTQARGEVRSKTMGRVMF